MFPVLKIFETFSPPDFMLDLQSIKILDDSSFIIGAVTSYYQNELGVSKDSSKDAILRRTLKD